jgi:hypothetical protein
MHSPLPFNFSLAELGTYNSISYAHVFEHRPVWIGLAISDFEPPPVSIPNTPSARLEIHKDDEPCYSEFKQFIELWTETNLSEARIANASMSELSNLLAALSVASLDAVAKVKRQDKKAYLKSRCQGRRDPLKDGYYPEMRLIQDAMHLFIRLRVRAYDSGHTLRWHHGSSYAIILTLVSAWRAKFQAHFPADHDKDPLGINESSLQPDLNPNRANHSQLTRAFFDERIAMLRRKLHGRLRTQLRLKMSERVRQMQLCLEQNKIRDVLLKLGNKQRHALDRSFLQSEDASITTNPIEIHEKLTDHF